MGPAKQASTESEPGDMQNVHEFARRFRLSSQEEHRLIARYRVTAPRIDLLANARRELSSAT
ncbi:hypothetical protein QO002_005358 [Pararhizobium capsulatum DSM 1112]|uniref:DUF3606 domain-containing protein n=1 Tax=Pararhizobium capsulatum DSM 1112 TaxID=1121113 RepID=A0ABU0C218_9HYPH|nr:hypothetical protein [Pararhizobium capsulatum]MDQ0323152.1 hypothetical protein [Pararhizobium capsulatum DSM 1112]